MACSSAADPALVGRAERAPQAQPEAPAHEQHERGDARSAERGGAIVARAPGHALRGGVAAPGVALPSATGGMSLCLRDARAERGGGGSAPPAATPAA